MTDVVMKFNNDCVCNLGFVSSGGGGPRKDPGGKDIFGSPEKRKTDSWEKKQQLGDSHNTSHYISMSSGNSFMGNFGEDISPKPTTWIVARCTVICLALMNRLCQKNDHLCVGNKLPT